MSQLPFTGPSGSVSPAENEVPLLEGVPGRGALGEPASEPVQPDAGSAPEASVRVHLAVGGVGLRFAGRRTFFDRHVGPLIEAAYRRAGGLPTDAEQCPAADPLQAAASPAGLGSVVPSPVVPELPTFKPSAPARFQQYAGQVGANAGTVDQRIMAFAFYLWNYEREDTFDSDAIVAFFRTVHEEPPENLPELLQGLCDSKRWLEPAGAAWRMTTKGVNYVKNRLLGE
ncbi:MAG: hypothetical protein O2894_00550 [Planctomycetota bacterium]|nr:hypothetical protein [Planctomycetota bacterium]